MKLIRIRQAAAQNYALLKGYNMNLSKFLLLTVVATMICVLYVYQQSEIFRMAYAGQKKLGDYQELLDKNAVLKYNIERSASLIRLGAKINQAADFQMPDTFQLVRLDKPLEGQTLVSSKPRQSLAARIFSVKRQAEAKTINSSASLRSRAE